MRQTDPAERTFRASLGLKARLAQRQSLVRTVTAATSAGIGVHVIARGVGLEGP